MAERASVPEGQSTSTAVVIRWLICCVVLSATAAVGFSQAPPASFRDDFSRLVLGADGWTMKLGVGSFNATENPGYLRNRIDPNTYTRTYPSDDGAFGLYRSFSGDRWIVEAKVGYSFPAPFLPDFATGRRFFLHVISFLAA